MFSVKNMPYDNGLSAKILAAAFFLCYTDNNKTIGEKYETEHCDL